MALLIMYIIIGIMLAYYNAYGQSMDENTVSMMTTCIMAVMLCIAIMVISGMKKRTAAKMKAVKGEKAKLQTVIDAQNKNLKPCPSCGNIVCIKMGRTLHMNRDYEAACKNCGYAMWDYSMDRLIRNWNTAAELVEEYRKENGADADVSRILDIIKTRPDYSL